MSQFLKVKLKILKFNIMFKTQKPTQYFKICINFVFYIMICNIIGQTLADTRPLDRYASTIYYNNSPPDKNGHFNYEFQTTNGITIKSAGNEYGFSGVVQYISPEGLPITMTYVADSDGYHPNGEYLPKLPDHNKQHTTDIRSSHHSADKKIMRKL